MKRCISMLLVVFLLLTCMLTGTPEAHASARAEKARTIAIVFDNSGSMYDVGDMAWCRATYAMEVFASMLNTGDTLLIYPMHPITVDGQTYTMEAPLKITDSAKAATLREINTENAGGTPIESIDCAISGLKVSNADLKYLIVLTDGGTFSKNSFSLTKARTRTELDNRIQENTGKDMPIMYLGIGSDTCMPDTPESAYFAKRQAVDSADVLSSLTEMCNMIFGRDSLPQNHLSDTAMDFDISMRKLIVFVQGENIADLKVTDANGKPVGTLVSSQQTKYSTVGTTDWQYKNGLRWDESLQGMMVTYTDCAPGNYKINYSGSASDVEVYYEPDADLDFVFTDANGNTVRPDALYDGEYKVGFGIKDAKTGKLISSDLLGKPKYEGSYSINGVETAIEHEGQSGEVPVTLNVGDNFEATLTVTYLSGYTITKDSTDFGWPNGGIKVAARPAGELRLEISGGAESYSLQYLEEGTPFIAEVYYEGSKVTGKELEKVALKWQPETSNAEIMETFADDHYDLTLHYKDPTAPQNTVCGECTVIIYAHYAPKGHSESVAECPITYNIIDDFSPLQVNLRAEQDYFVISKMENSKPLIAEMALDGNPLTAGDFENVRLDVVTGGIEYELTPNAQNSCYEIRLLPTDGVEEGKYPIHVTATYTDPIGRETTSSDSLNVKLSGMPLWLKWAIGILALLLLILIIWLILHIKMFPKHVRQLTNECYMGLNGKDVTSGTDFKARLNGKTLIVRAEYGGQTVGINLGDLKPGPNGILCKPSPKRNISVANPEKINMTGDITQADINGVLYIVDRATGKLVPEDETQRPYLLANAAMISFDGRMEDGGRTKKFHADIPLTFKKK